MAKGGELVKVKCSHCGARYSLPEQRIRGRVLKIRCKSCGEVFEVRHHAPRSAYGLRLPGSFVFTGDTRPIPEVLGRYEEPLVAHDCVLVGNPSHCGIDDLEREYPRELLDRLLLYHYACAADAERLRQRGYATALPGHAYALLPPSPVLDNVV